MKKPTQKRRKSRSRKRAQPSANPSLDVAQNRSRDAVAVKETKKKTISQTPKKEAVKKVEGKTSVFRYVTIALQFFRESRIELKKVKWPTRKELLASTAIVIFLVLIVALYLGLVDFGLIKIIRNVVG